MAPPRRDGGRGRWPCFDAAEPRGQAQFCGGVVLGWCRVLTAGHAAVDVGNLGHRRPHFWKHQVERRSRWTAAGQGASASTGFVNDEQPGVDAAVLTLGADIRIALRWCSRDPDRMLSRAPRHRRRGRWAPPRSTLAGARRGAGTTPTGCTGLQVPMQGRTTRGRLLSVGDGSIRDRLAKRLCAGAPIGKLDPATETAAGPSFVGSPGAWLDVGILSGGDSCTARGYFDLYARVDCISGFALTAGLVVQPDPVRPAHKRTRRRRRARPSEGTKSRQPRPLLRPLGRVAARPRTQRSGAGPPIGSAHATHAAASTAR